MFVNLTLLRLCRTKWLRKPILPERPPYDPRAVYVAEMNTVGDARPSGSHIPEPNVFVVGDCVYKKVANNA